MPAAFTVRFASDDAIVHMPRPLRVIGLSVENPQFHLLLGRDAGRQASAVFGYTLGGCGCLQHGGRRDDLPPGRGFLVDLSADEQAAVRLGGDQDGWDALLLVFAGAGDLVAEVVRRIGNSFQLPQQSHVILQLQRYAGMDGQELKPNRAEAARQVLATLAAIIDHNLHGPRDAGYSHLVRQARDALLGRVEHQASIADLAKELGVSQEHLTRAFSKEVGESPGQFLSGLRIRRACELLKATNLPISAIAERLGHESPSHFARVFKQATGMTPSAFREHESVSLF